MVSLEDLRGSSLKVYCPFCGKQGKSIIVDCRAYDEEVIEYYKCEFCGKVHGM